MKSLNFEFLRRQYPELADLGGFAEHYAFSDPSSSLVKLRTFAEDMVAALYAFHELPRAFQASLNDMLHDDTFKQIVPPVVINKLHALRTHGNKAAHGKGGDFKPHHSNWLVEEAYDLGRWFFLSVCGGEKDQCGEFNKLTEEKVDETTQLRREKTAYLNKLAEQEAQMAKLLADLDTARAKAKREEKTAEELQAILNKTQQAASALDFDEEATRYKLIDSLLVEAGWDVGPRGKSTAEVGQEIEVPHQPTKSGIGRADYVLWNDDGKPLAVIEAKKTAVEAKKGQHQARLYADGLEKVHGQRPVIFYTNGYDIFIWDDAKKEPPRKLFGFHSKDSLQYLRHQTVNRSPVLAATKPKEKIVDRMYQVEAIKRICERFDERRRKALLVQATGTGKTRVAIALCDVMVEANWAKRILFLCDRRELRKQARDGFIEHLPGAPLVYVKRATAEDKEKRVYLATYPAMMKCFQNFDVGFFDLVIADESHRSIYNRYRDLFTYFDAYQVGLTATPVKFVARDTYKLFECEADDPTAEYSYDAAITHRPRYLTPFEVAKHTTKFLREGIKFSDMTPAQRAQLEEQVEDSEAIDYEREQVSKAVFNKDTDRAILRNLMEKGLKVDEGSKLGKTIVFARNHDHAVQLHTLFDELYPQYGGTFCAVIDNYEPRAEQLIDDFKTTDGSKDLTIAISVDMLDTGIDVPSILNLVFAKPVKSYAKFWQMIGRGTRLCPDLLGPGKDKERFLIFDHWGNFEWFDELKKEVDPGQTKSLLQVLFESRIKLGQAALDTSDFDGFEIAHTLLEQDVNALPEDTIAVREKWREVKAMQQAGVIKGFQAATLSVLRGTIAPLMQWRNVAGKEAAYRFDLVATRLCVALLRKSAEFEDRKADLLADVAALPVNLSQVAEKKVLIEAVKQPAFWKDVTVKKLDELRRELRGIMHLKQKDKTPAPKPLILDVSDTDEVYGFHEPKMEGLDLVAYRARVESVFTSLLDKNAALRKIRAGQPVSDDDIRELADEIAQIDPSVSLEDLLEVYPNKARKLELAIRRVVGMEPEKVNEIFTAFVNHYPKLSGSQIRFLDLLKNHIAKYGAIEKEKLWEAPFTSIDSDGVSGVFEEDAQIDELLEILNQLNFEES